MKADRKNSGRLSASYFDGNDVVDIARSLLGKNLCTNIDGYLTTGVIVETEAYRAPEDKASHAYLNRRTDRTEVMFGKAGHAYVYLCYGIHHLFNIVTGPIDVAHAVLIRAVEPRSGLESMLIRRKMSKSAFRLTAGPGSLSIALGLNVMHTGIDLNHPESPIWIEEDLRHQNPIEIISSPRVGVKYAAECAEWAWRFRIKDNPWTSPAK